MRKEKEGIIEQEEGTREDSLIKNPAHSNQEAKLLNDILRKQNPFLDRILSRRGKSSFFPKQGILTQSAEAKGKKINATAGIALDEEHGLMHLSSLQQGVNLPPKETSSYAPSHGLSELRKLWKEKQNCNFLTSLPLVTCGLTNALNLASFLFVDEGDEVILPEPSWENYSFIFSLREKAVISTYLFFQENRFNLAGFRKALLNKVNNFKESNRKKIVVLNFPHNPTGYSPTEEEAKEIVEILKEAANVGLDLVVICDDAYAGFVFKRDIQTPSLFHLLGNCHENILAVKADGASKELYAWGLRVAFITYAGKNISAEALSILEEKTAGAIRSSISSCSTLSQNLVIKTLTERQNGRLIDEEQRLKAILQKRHDLVVRLLETAKYREVFMPLPFNSGYFLCLKLNQNTKVVLDGEAVRKLLLEKYDTGVISFQSNNSANHCSDNYLRIAYSSVSTENLASLMENIYLACKELSKQNLDME